MNYVEKKLIVVAGCGLLAGMASMTWWYNRLYPTRPLVVALTNDRADLVPLVKIEHGGDQGQEHILVTQLGSHETRLINLNHEPLRGYSVEAQLSNGKKVEACVGKMTNAWVNRVHITEAGISEGD